MSFERFLPRGVLTVASAVLPVPIAVSVAERRDLASRATRVCITLTASIAVIPPIGCQTKLMCTVPAIIVSSS